MSHEIPPYNTLMSQDQKRNMPQMQIAYLKHSYIFPGTASTVRATKTPSSSLTKTAALQTSMKHSALIVTFRPRSRPTLIVLRWIWPTTFECFGINSTGNTRISDRAKLLSGKPIPISCSLLRPNLSLGYCSALFARLAPAAFGWKRHIRPWAR